MVRLFESQAGALLILLFVLLVGLATSIWGEYAGWQSDSVKSLGPDLVKSFGGALLATVVGKRLSPEQKKASAKAGDVSDGR